MTIIGPQVDLTHGILHDVTPDRVPEGFIEEDGGVGFVDDQHQVEGRDSETIMTFLPILQSVSPEAPKFWGAGCDLEPVVADEEEVIRALLQSSKI